MFSPLAGSYREDTIPEDRMKKIAWADLALWLPTLFLVYVFANQGASKFSDTSGWARAFAAWNYPVWFRILIGVMETGGALLLLTRRTASIGAALIAIVMLGAVGTHLHFGQARYITSEVVPLTLSLVVLFGRWRHFAGWALRPRDREAA
jgi:putative oxidoreductase